MKRFIAILLAMVMVLGLGTMAMAVAPNDKVQINNMMVDASMVEAKVDAQAAVEEHHGCRLRVLFHRCLHTG